MNPANDNRQTDASDQATFINGSKSGEVIHGSVTRQSQEVKPKVENVQSNWPYRQG